MYLKIISINLVYLIPYNSVQIICIKTGILISFRRVSTTVWQNHVDSNETLGRKLDEEYTMMLHAVLNKSRK